MHGVIDITKLELDKKDTVSWFIGDQIAHLLTIVVAAIFLTSSFPTEISNLGELIHDKKSLRY